MPPYPAQGFTSATPKITGAQGTPFLWILIFTELYMPCLPSFPNNIPLICNPPPFFREHSPSGSPCSLTLPGDTLPVPREPLLLPHSCCHFQGSFCAPCCYFQKIVTLTVTLPNVHSVSVHALLTAWSVILWLPLIQRHASASHRQDQTASLIITTMFSFHHRSFKNLALGACTGQYPSLRSMAEASGPLGLLPSHRPLSHRSLLALLPI